MAMEENIKKVVDSIMGVINDSETYSFEENPAPIFNILLKNWENTRGITHSEMPNGYQNRWNRLTNSDFINNDSDVLLRIEELIDANVLSETSLLRLMFDLSCKIDNNDYLDGIKCLLEMEMAQRLWTKIGECNAYSYAENPTPIIKFLIDQYFQQSGKCSDGIPNALKNKWNEICELSEQVNYDFSNILSDFTNKESYKYLDFALFFIKKYEASYKKRGRVNEALITPWKLEEFVYGLKLDDIANRLWDIINSTYTYSFKKEPLPVFQVLVGYYREHHKFKDTIPEKWTKTLDELEQNTHNCIKNTAKEMFAKFRQALETKVDQDEKLLSNVVNFFAEKYSEFNTNEGGEYILPTELVDFIYWYAVGTEACTTELAIYNPFAGIAAYGEHHVQSLNSQLNDRIENINDLKEVLETEDEHKNSSWYHGVESNQTNRLIGNVRLFVNNPINLEQIYITSDDSMSDEIDGFTGGWTFIATPPIGSKDVSTDNLVDIMTNLVDKFITASGMEHAFFVLEKSFCSDKAYYKLRRKFVDTGILASVIDLPQNIFKVPFDAVLVCLDKCTDGYSIISNESCFIRFIDAKHFVDKDNNNVFTYFLDKNNSLLDVCIEKPNNEPFCVIINHATVCLHGYTLIPELYFPMQVERKPGEVSICLKEFLSFADRTDSEEEKGDFILEHCFRNDSKILFESVDLETCEIEEAFPKYEGEYLVVSYMRDKFLMCKTSPNQIFSLRRNQVALKLKEDSLLSLDYVISAILRSGYLNKLALSMNCRDFDNGYYKSKVVDNILDSHILVHFDKNLQEETIAILKAEFERDKAAEEAAEKQRTAHREISSDISHMLGTTFDRIGDGLAELKGVEGAEEIMVQMKDSFDYMKRLIDSVGKDFSKSKSKMKTSEKNVNDFFVAYCNGWKNYGKNTFDVRYESSVSDETTFMIDEVFMKVLLDTLLDNAYRHGFDRYKSPEHQVRIATSFVSMDNKKYILLSVANNGKPLPDGLTIEKYISRGEFCGESGRTGLGGNHVYNIAKCHDGFICLTNDEKWSVNVEVLLPVEYYEENENDKFVVYGNAKECL